MGSVLKTYMHMEGTECRIPSERSSEMITRRMLHININTGPDNKVYPVYAGSVNPDGSDAVAPVTKLKLF
jgi:hypothetical protein